MRPPARLAPALLLLAAGTALSAPPFGPRAAARVSAGGFRGVVLERAAAGVQERELVLSLDGGETFPLRLTAGIGPGDAAASWRVPALPTEHAVLALREGSEESGERIVGRSAEFAIVTEPSAPAETLRFRDGEWKTREADSGSDALPVPSLRGAAPERCEALILLSDPFEETVQAVPPDPARQWRPGGAPASGQTEGDRPPVPALSVSLPLRE